MKAIVTVCFPKSKVDYYFDDEQDAWKYADEIATISKGVAVGIPGVVGCGSHDMNRYRYIVVNAEEVDE